MQWLCKLFGHRWVFDRNEPTNCGWWWEYFKCRRCRRGSRQMVASPRG